MPNVLTEQLVGEIPENEHGAAKTMSVAEWPAKLAAVEAERESEVEVEEPAPFQRQPTWAERGATPGGVDGSPQALG